MIVGDLLFSNRDSNSLGPHEVLLLADIENRLGFLLENGQPDQALALCQQALDTIGRVPVVLKSMAQCLFKLGRHENAAQRAYESADDAWAGPFLRDMVMVAPKKEQPTVIYFLCCSLARQAQWCEAERILRELLRVFPDHIDLCLLLSGILMETDRAAEALAAFHHAGRCGLKGYVGIHSRLVEMPPAFCLPPGSLADYHKVHDAMEVKLSHVTYHTPETFVLHARNATLLPGNCSLLLEGSGCLVHDGLDTNSRESMTLLPHYHIRDSRDRLLLDPPEVQGEITEECLLFGGGPNFSHGLNDWCSKLFVWSGFEKRKDLPMLVSKSVPQSVLEWMDLLDYPMNRIHWLEPGMSYHCRDVWAPSLTHRYQQMSPRYLKFIRRKARQLTGDRIPSRRLYFSRGMAKYRHVTNETEMERMLHARGFETLHPETLDMRQQLEILAEASIMVAPTGGASAASLFLPEGSMHVALQTTLMTASQYSISSQLSGIRYAKVLCHGDDKGNQSLLQDADFRVDLSALSAVLDHHGFS